MIVQCDQCQAKYRIADEKITVQGVRVRCAKCDHVFSVKAPAAPDAKSPESSGAARVHPAGDRDHTRPAPPSTPAANQGRGPERPRDGEEPEKKHAQEVAPPEDGPEQHLPKVLGDFSGPDDSHDLERGPAETGPGDSGGVRDRESAPSEEDQGLLPDLTEGDQPLGRPEDEFTKVDTGPANAFQPSAQLPGDPPTDGPDMDWGNIALESRSEGGGNDTDMDLAPTSHFGATESGAESSLDVGRSPTAPAPRQEPVPAPREVTTGSRAAAPPQPARKSGKGLFFIVIIALLAAGGYFLYPKALQFMESRSPSQEETLTVQNIVVGTVKQSGGTLLAVVRGTIRNDSSASKGMIQVQGTFKGPDGRALAETTSFCGNTFTDGELAANSLENIRSALSNELGQSLSNASLKPGEVVPFLIVLENPPTQIKEVTVTVKKWSSTT